MNSDRIITIACWTGIVLVGLGALGSLVSGNISGVMMCLSLAGFCGFVLLRRAENAARRPTDETPATAFQTPDAPSDLPPRYLTMALPNALAPPSRYVATQPTPVALPARVTQKWLTETVPRLDQSQVPGVLHELRSRGWSDDKIQTKVLPLLNRW